MVEEDIDENHPRYNSLMMRKKISEAGQKGMLAQSAMIAHGRGEAFDYLLGEQRYPLQWLLLERWLQGLVQQRGLFCR